GVDDGKVCAWGVVDQLVAIELEQAEHPLAVDQILGAAKTYEGIPPLGARSVSIGTVCSSHGGICSYHGEMQPLSAAGCRGQSPIISAPPSGEQHTCTESGFFSRAGSCPCNHLGILYKSIHLWSTCRCLSNCLSNN